MARWKINIMFQYVSILIRAAEIGHALLKKFTFQYVSILIAELERINSYKDLFTFQYVSILILARHNSVLLL